MKKLTLTLVSCWIFLSPNVVLSETMYDLGKRDGIYYKKFSDVPFNGKITGNPHGEFNNGKREGTWVWENKNGQINTKGNYTNGKEEGTWTTYYDSGTLSDKGGYKNGKKEGIWARYWNKAGLMSKGTFKDGKAEGAWVWYNQDGAVWKEYTGTYKDGKKIRD
jgi:hypothetical protein